VLLVLLTQAAVAAAGLVIQQARAEQAEKVYASSVTQILLLHLHQLLEHPHW
jgi:hypothetical protein